MPPKIWIFRACNVVAYNDLTSYVDNYPLKRFSYTIYILAKKNRKKFDFNKTMYYICTENKGKDCEQL
jgi:hypothetical protein